jgi:outer membrane protein insertion porin family
MNCGKRSQESGVRSQNVAILCLILALTGFGQTQKKRTNPPPPAEPEAPTVFPLETLKVTGNRRIASGKIIAAAAMKIGAPVVKEDFDKARNRLLATGAFENVAYEFKPSASKTGYDGVFDVAEVEQIFSYRFEDLPMSETDLRAALRKMEPVLGDQIPATAEVLERYTREIQALVGDKVKVIGKVSPDVPGQLTILFRSDAPRPQVAEVHFTGNQVLPSVDLARSLGDVAVGAAYSETTLRLMLDSSIRPMYDARGRIRVKFPKITTSPANEVDGVVVTVAVEEGDSYSLGAVTFTGATRQESAEAQKIANIQSADVANFDDVNAGLDKILARFRTKGYLKAAGHVDRDIDDQKHKVDIAIVLEPGPRYTMGKLTITGLDLLSEPVIRRMWGLKPGDAFEPQYPDSFLKDIREQGLFDNLGKTLATPDIDDKLHIVNVKLVFGGGGGEEEKKHRKKQ